MFEFREPLLLGLVVFAPVVAILAARRTASATFSSLELVDAVPPTFRSRLAVLPALLLGLAWVLGTIALAGPRSADATSEVKREGIAIAMVVDRSGSMQARDFARGDTSRSRLDVVKDVFRDFVLGGGAGDAAGRPDDLVGLVVFARYADGLCPLTLDHRNLAAILDDVAIATERSEDGTAVGDGLALAVERLRHHPAPSKVAILLTDGVSNSGDVQPLQAADLAVEHGVKVYAIGAGSTGFASVPVTLANGRTVLQRARVEMDEKTLKQIADRTGGRYFRASDEAALAAVTSEIDRLERGEVTEIRYLEYRHHYAGFTGGALASLALSALLAATWLRRAP